MGSDAHQLAWQIEGRGIRDPAVLCAMRTVPRQEFVPQDLRERAYDDNPLPIGHGQTISQPYIVAAMTEALALRPTSRVLEVGTGSGYQSAILAEIVASVYSIERIPILAEEARQRLSRLGYGRVSILVGDGYLGWPEHAPYDGILVTCAAEEVPDPLVGQLADGGRLVLPVGAPGGLQVLWLVQRAGHQVSRRRLMTVAFVPLLRGQSPAGP